MKKNYMSAKELIKKSAIGKVCIEGDQKVIFIEIADTAVNMAHMEMKERAIKAFGSFVEDYCNEAGRYDISKNAEHYINIFKKQLNRNE